MKTHYTIEELERLAADIRASIIKSLEEAGSGHSAGPLGLADIFTALYFAVAEHDPYQFNTQLWRMPDTFLFQNYKH